MHYLVVQIREPRDPLTGIGGYEQRFTFRSDQTDEAWKCYTEAIRNGFEGTCERVLSPGREESTLAERH